MQTPVVALQWAAEAHVIVVTQPFESALHVWRSAPLHCQSPVWHVAGWQVPVVASQSASDPQSCSLTHPSRVGLHTWSSAPAH